MPHLIPLVLTGLLGFPKSCLSFLSDHILLIGRCNRQYYQPTCDRGKRPQKSLNNLCGVAWLVAGNVREGSKHSLVFVPWISPRPASDFQTSVIYFCTVSFIIIIIFYCVSVILPLWLAVAFRRISGTSREEFRVGYS